MNNRVLIAAYTLILLNLVKKAKQNAEGNEWANLESLQLQLESFLGIKRKHPPTLIPIPKPLETDTPFMD
jgi:hypothetical protein